MKPRLLFLSNPFNDGVDEDRLLIKHLSADFDFIVCHPDQSPEFFGQVEGVVIRNIWPTHEFQARWEHVKLLLRQSMLFVYNPLIFKGDIEGKDYLVELDSLGYPVIPSIGCISDLKHLSDTEMYWVKPKFSCDGFGAAMLTAEELLARDNNDFIIQPFMEFEYEPSFFFVDNVFHHAIRQKHRLASTRTDPYVPTSADLEFAQAFVDWAAMPYGIQRIDAIRTKDGQLLLTEIENLCPYLYVMEVDRATQRRFLESIRSSINSALAAIGNTTEPGELLAGSALGNSRSSF